MKNIIANSKEAFKHLEHSGTGANRQAVQFYSEAIDQISLMRAELAGIDPEDLTRAEKNILKILDS